MVDAADTGMEKGDLKKLLIRSKKEPVSCGVAMSGDGKTALMMLHKMKHGRAVMGELTKKFPDAKNPRFGTASVDVDTDPKLVVLTLNKPTPGLARKMKKTTLKGTGFTKVRIQLEDGSIDDADEVDEEEAEAATASSGRPAAAAEAPAPAQAAPAEQTLAAAAPVEAATASEPAPEAAADPAAPAQEDMAPHAKHLTEVVRRMVKIVAADPSRQDELMDLATKAQTAVKGDNVNLAAEAIEVLERAVDEPAAAPAGADATPGPAAGAKPPADPKAIAKSRVAWVATRAKVESELAKLQSEIMKAYEGHDMAADLEKAFDSKVEPVLGTLDESLAHKLDEVSNATDPGERASLVAEAQTIMGRYKAYLANEPLIAALDNNPFVPIAVQKTLAATLDALSKAVH